MSDFYALRVVDIKPQTDFAKEITFEIPHHQKRKFQYKAGQYLTLKFNLNGEEVRRSYSLCSSPTLEASLKIGVKRVKNGLVSNYINDKLKIGDTIEVMPPDGRFFVDVKKGNYKTYYLFAGGSGITPILSILKSILQTEKHSFVNMMYANRSQETIMFQAELEQLQAEFPDRFILIHYLSKPKTSWMQKEKLVFEKGRVDADAIRAFMNQYPPYAQNVEYYICGPEKMKDNIVQSLQNIDVPQNRIFVESFGSGEAKAVTGIVENANLTALLNGEKIHTQIKQGKTILRSLLDNGNNPPYSCEGGVCSSCMCKIIQGKVAMRKNLALTEDEVANGYILSCQSLPLSEKIEVVFE